MAKDRDERYSTAGAVATDLRAAITGAAPETVAVPAEPPTRVDATTALPQPRRRRRWGWAAAVVTLLVVAAAAAAVWATHDSNSTPSSSPDLRPFVDRIENVLEQSAAGRREIAAALSAGNACKISNAEAARRIDSVATNRQSVLQQLASLAGPTRATDRMVTLLQRGLQQSIEADRHYRDGFLTSTKCPLPANQSFDLARASDDRATTAKELFVARFHSLAASLDRREWTAGQF